jgi:uncharacterized protein YukJ
MPLRSYGVLVGRAVGVRREGARGTPHYQVQVSDESGTGYRIAVNVLSQQAPSELRYLVDDDFRHPVLTSLQEAAPGWTRLEPGPGGRSLDYIRGNLFDRADMRLLPPDVDGPDNDLADVLDLHVRRAVADPGARVYAFGERWGPEPAGDKIFGFRPGNGVHDIHMNQGNSAAFRKDDGVWQDGGLLLNMPGQGRWVAIFLAFQSQAWHTDDTTGHALEPDVKPSVDGRVRIVAALVNPAGPDPEPESVTVLNASPDPVDLTGWSLMDRLKKTCTILGEVLPAGGTARLGLTDGMHLGNKGGSITLVDPRGLKVDGVSYTADDVEEGWTVVF